MHFFSQYRGLRRENYVLFFGRIVTNMGSMVWPMLTMILNQKLGMSAGNIAILTAVFGILMMPATLFGGKLADRLNMIFLQIRTSRQKLQERSAWQLHLH